MERKKGNLNSPFSRAFRADIRNHLFVDEVPTGKKFITSRDVRWTCDFCAGEIKLTNIYNQNKHIAKFNEVLILSSSLKIQSFFRMAYHRNRYCKLLNGVTALQELFRVRKLKIQNEIRKSNVKRPFRIRIHDIHLLIPKQFRLASSSTSSNLNASPTSNLANKPATVTNNNTNNNSSNSGTNFQVTPPKSSLRFIGEMTSIVYENVFGVDQKPNKELCIRDKDRDIIDLLSQGHVENPPYCRPHRQFQPAIRGSLFLTVTVHEVPSYGSGKEGVGALPTQNQLRSKPDRSYDQLFRMDFPLKMMSPPTSVKPQQLAKLGFDCNPDPSAANNTSDVNRIAKQFQLATFNISKSPYILVPFVGSNIELRMTISEITDYPNAVLMGQLCFPVHYYLFYERIVSLRQPLQDSFSGSQDSLEVPQLDDGCKINIFLPDRGPFPNSSPSATNTNSSSSSLTSSSSSGNANQSGSGNGRMGGNTNSHVSNSHDRDLASFNLPTTTITASSSNNPINSNNNSNNGIRPSTGHVRGNSSNARMVSNRPLTSDPHLRALSAHCSQPHMPLPDQGGTSASKNKLLRDACSQYVGGVLTWSLLSFGHSELSNEAGYLILLSQEFVTSTKRKCWCLLIDRMLMIYSIDKSGENVTLKQQLELTQAAVSLLDCEVIKIKTSAETLFLHCITQKEHDVWFRKLYMQSSSHSSLPFPLYLKKVLAAHPNPNLALQGQPRRDKSFSSQLLDPEQIYQAQMAAILRLKRSGGKLKAAVASKPKPVERTPTDFIRDMELEVDTFLNRMQSEYVDFDSHFHLSEPYSLIQSRKILPSDTPANPNPGTPVHPRAGHHSKLIDVFVASVQHAKYIKLI